MAMTRATSGAAATKNAPETSETVAIALTPAPTDPENPRRSPACT
jgi:hypothetical protein